MNLGYSFKAKKDFRDMDLNVKCYWETDDDEIRITMNKRFKAANNIPIIRTSFFQAFIDGMSTLYSNTFVRESNLPAELEQNLNYCMQDHERYLHLSREAAVYFENESSMVPLDASQYLVDDSDRKQIRVFLKSEVEDAVYLFVENDAIYRKPGTSISDVYTLGRVTAPLEEIRQTWLKINDLKALPFVFLRYPKLPKPMLHPLVSMQTNFIISMSWGYYNIDPKLLTQFAVKTDAPSDETNISVSNLGRTSKALVFGAGDAVEVIDTGDLAPLKDALSAYDILIRQRALQYGVDVSLVNIAANPNESGEAKKIERSYINQKRKKWFRIFENFEQRLIEQYNLVFGTKYTLNSISFADLPLSSDETEITTTGV